jgi:hypothetical protein
MVEHLFDTIKIKVIANVLLINFTKELMIL